MAQHKPGVLEKVNEVAARLKKAGFRVKVDDSEQSPGWKFAEYEMKGVPVRLELEPKDMETASASWSAGTTERRPLSPWRSWKPERRRLSRQSTTVSSPRPRRTWTSTSTPPTAWRRLRSSRRSTAASSRPCGVEKRPAS